MAGTSTSPTSGNADPGMKGAIPSGGEQRSLPPRCWWCVMAADTPSGMDEVAPRGTGMVVEGEERPHGWDPVPPPTPPAEGSSSERRTSSKRRMRPGFSLDKRTVFDRAAGSTGGGVDEESPDEREVAPAVPAMAPCASSSARRRGPTLQRHVRSGAGGAFAMN
mmetsp:Transcript_119312/g.297657  ORF Transcript_119312/g.297657 Transcript_119312/m.297657 type:complete len:164 (+) Transcript_119312:2502-2993(+)